MRRLRLLTLAALVGVTAACARGVTLNPDAGQTFAVNVINEMLHSMVIAYDDGQTMRGLGTVAANQRERFVIAPAESATVTIVATDAGDTHTVRRTVAVSPGRTVDVHIR